MELHNYSTPSSPAFSVIHQTRGGGVTGPDAKIQGYHQPIETKLGMDHYGHKRIPNAQFEAGSFSSFGDKTSQNLPRKKGTSHQIRLFTPRKRI